MAAATACRHGVSTAPGATAATTVFGLAAATAATSASAPSSSESEARSAPSEESVATHTTATSAREASAAVLGYVNGSEYVCGNCATHAQRLALDWAAEKAADVGRGLLRFVQELSAMAAAMKAEKAGMQGTQAMLEEQEETPCQNTCKMGSDRSVGMSIRLPQC